MVLKYHTDSAFLEHCVGNTETDHGRLGSNAAGMLVPLDNNNSYLQKKNPTKYTFINTTSDIGYGELMQTFWRQHVLYESGNLYALPPPPTKKKRQENKQKSEELGEV